MTWKEIVQELSIIEQRQKELVIMWSDLKTKCKHTNLPKHKLGDQYFDKCPDCGYISYSYEV